MQSAAGSAIRVEVDLAVPQQDPRRRGRSRRRGGRPTSPATRDPAPGLVGRPRRSCGRPRRRAPSARRRRRSRGRRPPRPAPRAGARRPSAGAAVERHPAPRAGVLGLLERGSVGVEEPRAALDPAQDVGVAQAARPSFRSGSRHEGDLARRPPARPSGRQRRQPPAALGPLAAGGARARRLGGVAGDVAEQERRWPCRARRRPAQRLLGCEHGVAQLHPSSQIGYRPPATAVARLVAGSSRSRSLQAPARRP